MLHSVQAGRGWDVPLAPVSSKIEGVRLSRVIWLRCEMEV